MSTAWTSRYALRTNGIKSAAIRELLKITQRPAIIALAGGLPAAGGLAAFWTQVHVRAAEFPESRRNHALRGPEARTGAAGRQVWNPDCRRRSLRTIAL